MESIFHEKQEGSLCAQHCLNALLQGSYFTPVDLAMLAQRMDDEERLRMAESGIDTEEYRLFLEQPSGNYDDSGYFSVQVISSALEVWNLELVPYNSSEPRALEAQASPTRMQAYICNYRDHWFTIRRLGHQWFNLNSLLTGPELLTDTYLGLFLAQLQQEGYSIFVVFGTFPECEAEHTLSITPAVQVAKPRRITVQNRLGSSTSKDSEEEREIQRALKLSLAEDTPECDYVFDTKSEQEEELRLALALSIEESLKDNKVDGNDNNEDKELRKAMELSLENDGNVVVTPTEESKKSSKENITVQNGHDESPDPDLERALKMSLECCNSNEATTTNIDVDEVRRRRLAFLERKTLGTQGNVNHPTTSSGKHR